MIHIEEIFPDKQTVLLVINGRLDEETLPTLETICNHYFKKNKNVGLKLKGVTHISLEGKDFLRKIQVKVILQDLPEFLKLEIKA